MTVRRMCMKVESWRLKQPLRITGYTMECASVVVVSVEQAGCVGRGEAAGVYYLDDDVEHVMSRLETVRSLIEAGIDRSALQHILPPGGARNALDSALWDLDAQLSGQPVWALAGLDQPRPLLTTFTCGADEPANMAAVARGYSSAKAIKLKLTGEPADARRVKAVRAARPDVSLAVDANQGFTPATLAELLPALLEANVSLIEQPYPIGAEAWLDDLSCPIRIAADESMQSATDLPALASRFDVVNIKLDKCGGLTEGLAIARAARLLGLEPMVGCMPTTSLGIAPAVVLGQLCSIADLDAPLFLETDRAVAADYSDGCVSMPEALWGGRARVQGDRG